MPRHWPPLTRFQRAGLWRLAYAWVVALVMWWDPLVASFAGVLLNAGLLTILLVWLISAYRVPVEQRG